jgi:assimilatory nitrate reductase catalytic subunit
VIKKSQISVFFQYVVIVVLGVGFIVGVKDSRGVYTKGNPKHFVNQGTLCPKGLSEHQILNSHERIQKPLRKNSKNARKD